MFSRLREWLLAQALEVFIYLYMESPWMWRQVFGYVPDNGGLARRLNEKVDYSV